MNDLALLQDLFGNSKETKLLICTVIFCLVFTVPAKWRVNLWSKIGHYRNRFLLYCQVKELKGMIFMNFNNIDQTNVMLSDI